MWRMKEYGSLSSTRGYSLCAMSVEEWGMIIGTVHKLQKGRKLSINIRSGLKPMEIIVGLNIKEKPGRMIVLCQMVEVKKQVRSLRRW